MKNVSILYFTLTSILFIFCQSQENESIVEYYENLINDSIQATVNYQSPNNSYYFVNKKTNKKPLSYGTFDFIIVGAGSAGCVVASRLSEISNISILLLEAGKAENNFTDIPIVNGYLKLSSYNWGYRTVPQKTSCLAQKNRQCPYILGKGLGGTSIINGLKYARGNKKDYDHWAELGAMGWSYEDVLPYFKKSEASTLPNEDYAYHGHDGYFSVEYDGPNSPVTDDFLKANFDLGREILDYNGKKQLGFSQTQFNTIKGRRDSSAKAFLTPTKDRKNLNVLTEALAMKVLIDAKTNKAIGVRFVHNFTIYDAMVSKEVILSAGVINSPQLLMLSGIGPKEHLRKMKIPLIKDLPVGKVLNDHPMFIGPTFKTNFAPQNETLKENIEKYLNGTGPFTISSSCSAMGYIRLNDLNPKVPEKADVEMMFIPPPQRVSGITSGYIADLQPNKQVWKDYVQSVDTVNAMSFVLYVLYPKSKGSVRLKSKSPFEFPVIDSGLLSDPEEHDLNILYEGVIKLYELLKMESLAKYEPDFIVIPGCEDYHKLSKQYWFCAFRQLTVSGHHGVSTCKMGSDSDNEAVVDNHGRVRGIKDLRVADVSIAPTIVSGHTNAVAIMIGEKVSDYIINDDQLWM